MVPFKLHTDCRVRATRSNSHCTRAVSLSSIAVSHASHASLFTSLPSWNPHPCGLSSLPDFMFTSPCQPHGLGNPSKAASTARSMLQPEWKPWYSINKYVNYAPNSHPLTNHSSLAHQLLNIHYFSLQ